jgi:hypothetical protein
MKRMAPTPLRHVCKDVFKFNKINPFTSWGFGCPNAYFVAVKYGTEFES